MNRSPASAADRLRAARRGTHSRTSRRRPAHAPRWPLFAAGIALLAVLAVGCALLFRAPAAPEADTPVPPAASAAPAATAASAPAQDDAGEAPAPAVTPAPAATLPDVTGDWLSEPDAETYAEVISLAADGSCTMISTMIPVDGGTDGWRDGSWYTAPMGAGRYTYADGALVFTLDTEFGEAVYTYTLTWLDGDSFRAHVDYEGSAYTLVFHRAG